jgi:hypothetical protein
MPGGKHKGVYNHWDSYPTELGAQVFNEARRRKMDALAALLTFYGDWRQVLSNSICQFCGKTAGQPHSYNSVISGKPFGEKGRAAFVAMRKKQAGRDAKLWEAYQQEIRELDEIAANLAHTGYPDPEAMHHQHGEGAADQFDPFEDPLDMEWIYVLRPEASLMEVWKGVEYSAEAARHWKRWSKRKIKYESQYLGTHVHVVDVLLSCEPDWAAIEKMGHAIRDQQAA